MTEKEFKKIKETVLKEIAYNDFNTPYEFILDWINNHCIYKSWSNTIKGCCARTSYGLKHLIEKDYPYYDKKNNRYIHGYCANNWVKCALYELEYDLKPVNKAIKINYDNMLDNSINYIYRNIYDIYD